MRSYEPRNCAHLACRKYGRASCYGESRNRTETDKRRTVWDAEKEEWYFSVVDVVEILTDSVNPRKYWSVLKTRLKAEGSELATNCSQLKMQSSDGKYYKQDVLDTKGILRLVQSIPSPKAEPFKMWLAEVGSERLDEIADPEKVSFAVRIITVQKDIRKVG